MSYNAEVYKVMIASPSDVTEERKVIREVIFKWNVVHSEKRKIVVLPVGWDTHSSPEMGNRPQAIINEQLKDCDLLIGVFWTRIGTPTGEYPSGTVEEIQEHINAKKPAMLYFSSAPVTPESIDTQQLDELKKFKGICISNGLCETYSDIIDFRSKLERQLQLKLNLDLFKGASQLNPEVMSDIGDIVQKMSTEAQTILRKASQSNGEIIVMFGHGIQIGKELIRHVEMSPREYASWDGAIDELERLDFIKDINDNHEIFLVTSKGYRAADKIGLLIPGQIKS